MKVLHIMLLVNFLASSSVATWSFVFDDIKAMSLVQLGLSRSVYEMQNQASFAKLNVLIFVDISAVDLFARKGIKII